MVIVAQEKERKIGQDPLRLRAHRLKHMAAAMGVGMDASDPEVVARMARLGVERLLEDQNGRNRDYAVGVVGKNGEYADIYEESLRRELERFVAASPRVPIEILEELPDNLCRRLRECGLGNHCLRRFAQNKDGSRDVLEESTNFNTFLYAAWLVGLGDELQVERTKAIFSDAPSIQARRIRTTVEVVKTILREAQELF